MESEGGDHRGGDADSGVIDGSRGRRRERCGEGRAYYLLTHSFTRALAHSVVRKWAHLRKSHSGVGGKDGGRGLNNATHLRRGTRSNSFPTTAKVV